MCKGFFLLFLICCCAIAGRAQQMSAGSGDSTSLYKKQVNNTQDTLPKVDLSKLEPIFENVFIYDFFTTINAVHYERPKE